MKNNKETKNVPAKRPIPPKLKKENGGFIGIEDEAVVRQGQLGARLVWLLFGAFLLLAIVLVIIGGR